MKNIIPAINKHRFTLLLWFFIGAYIVYFSIHSLVRYRSMYASYYDLGIMNQTVYNTYRGHILELTDPESQTQIKRMAIHNDLLLAAIAPLYFIHAGPETLLILQTVILALGAWAVYKISEMILKNRLLSLVFAIAYLFYSPMQRANLFDFHAVALATTFLVFMFYFWLKKSYRLSILFIILSLLTKEEVGLVTAFFGGYTLFFTGKEKKNIRFSLFVITVSLIWLVVSFVWIIPYFRGGNHFAADYYSGNPDTWLRMVFRQDTWTYFLNLLGPLGFLSVLSPLQLLIAIPEMAINLLSSNINMRNIIYHYTSVIQPFVFISAIYGTKKILSSQASAKRSRLLAMILLICTLLFSYLHSPLPYSQTADYFSFRNPQQPYKEVGQWEEKLKDDRLKISATGQVAPHFSSRRYLYLLSDRYKLADYVVLTPNEIYNYPEKDILVPIYERLVKDPDFQRIFNNNGLEIYKKKI